MTSMTTVLAQPQTDPTGDLQDRSGSPTVGEPYLDIIESEMKESGNNWVGTIRLAGAVPSSTSSDVFIEWDIMVDADEDPTTGAWPGEANMTWRQRIVNGIGVDVMVRVALSGTNSWAEIYFVGDKLWGVAFRSVSGNEITLTVESMILASHFAHAGSFDFTVLVRKYNVGGAATALPPANTLQAFDKAPNSGYYAYQAGTVNVVPEFQSTLLPVAVLLTVTMLVYSVNKPRRRNRSHGI